MLVRGKQGLNAMAVFGKHKVRIRTLVIQYYVVCPEVCHMRGDSGVRCTQSISGDTNEKQKIPRGVNTPTMNLTSIIAHRKSAIRSEQAERDNSKGGIDNCSPSSHLELAFAVIPIVDENLAGKAQYSGTGEIDNAMNSNVIF